jgi:hypothetical protein
MMYEISREATPVDSATVRVLAMWLQCFHYVMSLVKDRDRALTILSGEKTYELLSESS